MYKLAIAQLDDSSMPTKDGIITLHPSKDYTVAAVDGLAPPPANVVGTPLTSADGQTLNIHRIDARDIVITVYINNPVEKNRLKLYRIAHTKRHVQLNFKNGARDVHINGYIENIECDIFSMRQVAQITIKCLAPYFRDAKETHMVLNDTSQKFKFSFKIKDRPRSIFSNRTDLTDAQFEYQGDVPTGCEMVLKFKRDISDRVRITDTVTNTAMTINFAFKKGDILNINTHTGHKKITYKRGGKTHNLISSLLDGSTWVVLRPGINGIAVTTHVLDSKTNKYVMTDKAKQIDGTLKFRNKYLGV